MNSLFQSFLKSSGLSQTQLAADLGVTDSHVSSLKSGQRVPSLTLAVAIERATSGAVPASSWVEAASETSQSSPTPQPEIPHDSPAP